MNDKINLKYSAFEIDNLLTKISENKISSFTNDANYINEEKLKNEIDANNITLKSLALDIIYPIGSIYMNINYQNPNELFGGTWERIYDTFLLACGNAFPAGDQGGERYHTLTIDEMPHHWHTIYISAGNELAYGFTPTATRININSYSNTTGIGGDQPHNNMPPYIAVYMWYRKA